MNVTVLMTALPLSLFLSLLPILPCTPTSLSPPPPTPYTQLRTLLIPIILTNID